MKFPIPEHQCLRQISILSKLDHWISTFCATAMKHIAQKHCSHMLRAPVFNFVPETNKWVETCNSLWWISFAHLWVSACRWYRQFFVTLMDLRLLALFCCRVRCIYSFNGFYLSLHVLTFAQLLRDLRVTPPKVFGNWGLWNCASFNRWSVTGLFPVSATYSCLSNFTRFRSPTVDQLLVCF